MAGSGVIRRLMATRRRVTASPPTRPRFALNILPLAVDLPAHVFDFGSVLGTLHGPTSLARIEHTENKLTSRQVSAHFGEHPKARGSCAASQPKRRINET